MRTHERLPEGGTGPGRPRGWTIKRKLLVLGAATVVPAAAVLAWWTAWELRELTRARERELAVVSRQAAAHAQDLLEGLARRLDTLARGLAAGDAVPGLATRLGEVMTEYAELENVFVVEADGRLLASVVPPPDPMVTVADRPWFRRIMATGAPAVGGHQVGRVTGQDVVVVAVPVRRAEGPPTAVVGAALALRRLHRLFASVALGEGVVLAVVDEAGRVLSTAPVDDRAIGQALAPRPPDAWLVREAPVAGTGWTVSVGLPRAAIDAWVRREAVAVVLPLAAVLAASAIVGSLIARGVWRPLEDLLVATRKLRLGEPVEVAARSTDEVGELARAFSDTARALAEARRSLEARLGEHVLLNEASRLLTESLELPDVLHRLAELARDHLRVDVVRIWLLHAAAGEYRLAAQAGTVTKSERSLRGLRPGEGLVGWITAHQASLVVADLAADPRVRNREWMRAEGLVSFLGVPLLLEGAVTGILALMTRARRDFPPPDVALAEALARPAAVAIKNARLYEEARRRRQAAESLVGTGRLIGQSLDPERAAQAIVDALRALLGATATTFFRVDPESGDAVVMAVSGSLGPGPIRGLRFPRGTGVVGLALREGRPVATPNVLADPRVALTSDLRARLEQAPFRAAVVVPLVARGAVIGALSAGDHEGRVFDEEELHVIQTFADQAALALDNARLYDEARARAAELAERNRQLLLLHDVARTVSAEHDPARCLQRLVEAARELLGARAGALAVFEAEGRTGGLYSAGAADGPERLDESSEVRRLLEEIAREGRAVRREDPSCPPAPAEVPAELAAPGTSLLGAPIRRQEELLGALCLAGKPGGFTSDDESVLAALCADAAVAIDNARLVQSLRQALDDLQAAQDRLVRAETLRALGQLAAGAAHHLNNLLTVVLGRAQLLRRRVQDPAILRALDIMEQAGRDAADVVRRIQTFSRTRPAASRVPVDLNALAAQVVEMTRPRWHDQAEAAGIHVDVRLEPGPIPPVAGDPAALREVLVNLLLNAVDALPAGGTVRIATWAEQGQVCCTVSDDGVGMTEEVCRRALEPFFTTKGPHATGLGLSVSHGIIRSHGGDLTIASAPGQGTTVTLRLPAARTNPSPVPPAPGAAPAGPRRVLLVDDDPEVLEVVGELLTSEGHEVIACASGREALAVLETGAAVDLVLTDLGMPEMNGREVAHAVKARWPHLPVGLLTGWGDQPPGPADADAPVDFVIPKPVTSERLAESLARVGSRPS